MAYANLTEEDKKNLRCPQCRGGRINGDTPYCSCKSPLQVCIGHAESMIATLRRNDQSVDVNAIADLACDVQGHPELRALVRKVVERL